MYSLAKLIFPRPEFIYEEKPTENEPCVYLSNHAGPIGPAYAALYFKEPKKMWLINYALNKEKNANFFYHDFFAGPSKKHKKTWRFISKLVSFLLTPLLKSAPHVAVYHDMKMFNTFRDSLDALQNGCDLVIFPECPTKFSPFINSFYCGFSELGKMYYNETGKILKFYPTYLSKELKTVVVGKPIAFDPTVPARLQRKAIADGARDAIDALAKALPPHTPHEFLTKEWYECYGQYADNPMEYFKQFE